MEKILKRKKYVLKTILILGIIIVTQIYGCKEYSVFATENNVENLPTGQTPVVEKEIKDLKISTLKKSYTYTGKEIKPGISIYDGEKKLKNNKDYSIEYKKNKNVGTASIVIKGKGTYKGTVTKKYNIVAKKVKELKISMSKEPHTYTGKAIKASVKIYDGKKKLKVNKDYTLTYKKNKNAGKASVIIKGKGNYTGSKTKTYYIVPNKTKITSVLFNAKGTKVEVSWKRDKQADGYALYMATSKNGKYKKQTTLNGSKNTKVIGKGLKSNKTYYFKVKSYVKIDGKKIYSKKYSSAKTDTGFLTKVTLNSPMSGTNRNHNLKLACKTINGTVLEPGETFNWFRIVGSASRSKGYRKAGVFVGGKTVQGYGGGVCQVSSTIYQASKKIGLKIVERHTHSRYVPYTKPGEDATVSYGSKNLRVKNNKKYSIKMVTYSNKTKSICEIYRVID